MTHTRTPVLALVFMLLSIFASEARAQDQWILEPYTRMYVYYNTPLFHSNSGPQDFAAAVDMANAQNAGLFFNNLYGERIGYFHHDGGYDGWSNQDAVAEFEQALSRYRGPVVSLYLGVKQLDDNGELINVDWDRVEDHWLPLAARVEQLTGTKVEFVVDYAAIQEFRPRWWDYANRLRQRGYRTVIEAAVQDADGLAVQFIPQAYLWQYIVNQGWDPEDMPWIETTPGHQMVWCSNHQWIIEDRKYESVRSLWERGYAIAIEANEMATYLLPAIAELAQGDEGDSEDDADSGQGDDASGDGDGLAGGDDPGPGGDEVADGSDESDSSVGTFSGGGGGSDNSSSSGGGGSGSSGGGGGATASGGGSGGGGGGGGGSFTSSFGGSSGGGGGSAGVRTFSGSGKATASSAPNSDAPRSAPRAVTGVATFGALPGMRISMPGFSRSQVTSSLDRIRSSRTRTNRPAPEPTVAEVPTDE